MPGSTHWVIQALHLLLGLVAIGLAETLARNIKQRQTRRQRAQQAQALEGVVR